MDPAPCMPNQPRDRLTPGKPLHFMRYLAEINFRYNKRLDLSRNFADQFFRERPYRYQPQFPYLDPILARPFNRRNRHPARNSIADHNHIRPVHVILLYMENLLCVLPDFIDYPPHTNRLCFCVHHRISAFIMR
jgi:hypothetical protein